MSYGPDRIGGMSPSYAGRVRNRNEFARLVALARMIQYRNVSELRRVRNWHGTALRFHDPRMTPGLSYDARGGLRKRGASDNVARDFQTGNRHGEVLSEPLRHDRGPSPLFGIDRVRRYELLSSRFVSSERMRIDLPDRKGDDRIR